MVSLAKVELKRSAVADNDSGERKFSAVRTSSGTFIANGKDPNFSGIEYKISTWTFLPKDFRIIRPTIKSFKIEIKKETILLYGLLRSYVCMVDYRLISRV